MRYLLVIENLLDKRLLEQRNGCKNRRRSLATRSASKDGSGSIKSVKTDGNVHQEKARGKTV